jgi:hypothetical protein
LYKNLGKKNLNWQTSKIYFLFKRVIHIKKLSYLIFFLNRRCKYLSEYFTGIKLIKYFGWEKYAITNILDLRKLETGLILKETFFRTLIEIIGSLVPILISIIVFGFYVEIH